MKTKRVQVLMAPEEYEQLERAAKQQRVSVADLIRSAVREQHLRAKERRQQATFSCTPWEATTPYVSRAGRSWTKLAVARL